MDKFTTAGAPLNPHSNAKGKDLVLATPRGFAETRVPSGKRLHNYGTSPFFMGKSTISMAIFNSYVSHYQRVPGKSEKYVIVGVSMIQLLKSPGRTWI